MSSKEAQTGPASIAAAQRGERIASGLRVRGRYRVIDEIGSGAFGTVCVGEDESTGHRVAIRFLPRNFAATPQASQAVLRMGRSIIAASTSHSAMTRVLEFGELEAGRPFTVTEFVEGRRLSEILSGRAPLEVAAALRIALELGGAVETLHNMGFVHGAISPRNVVVPEDGRVKLLDIELAGLRDAREVQGIVISERPAEYLSPEQIQKAPISEKTDIYAFGVMLHELLTGAPPFQGPTRDAVLTKHLKDAPTPVHRRRDGVPAAVSRAVTLALYKQPEARPLMGDVLNLLWTGAHGPARRSQRAALVAGGVALAILAVVAVVWGVLALRPPASSSMQPAARPVELAPVTPAPPASDTRKVPAPAVMPPHVTGRAPLPEPPAASAHPPEPSVAPQPSAAAPAVSAPPVERPAPSARPPAASAPPETRPAPVVRSAPPAAPPTVAPSAPPAPPATPPAPRPTPSTQPAAPPAPATASPAPAVAPTPRPVPAAPAQATAPAPSRVEPREPSRTPPLQTPPAQTTPSGPEDSGAVIDWLLKPR